MNVDVEYQDLADTPGVGVFIYTDTDEFENTDFELLQATAEADLAGEYEVLSVGFTTDGRSLAFEVADEWARDAVRGM